MVGGTGIFFVAQITAIILQGDYFLERKCNEIPTVQMYLIQFLDYGNHAGFGILKIRLA